MSNRENFAKLLRQLDELQWQSPEALQDLQLRQLGALAAHFEIYSPQFQSRLREKRLQARDLAQPGGLQQLPILHRRELQQARDIFCTAVPDGHTPISETQTSGSTGEPVVVRRTALNQLDWLATTMREHLWHKRDFSKRICVVRANVTEAFCALDWGAPVNLLFESAPLLALPIRMNIGQQIEFLKEFEPHTLLVYPSNLAGILSEYESSGKKPPAIRQILSMGETLSSETRETAMRMFSAQVADMYSSQELGNIALQCPDSGLYHVMAENLIVEVLADDGASCRDGGIGRLVITDLRNYATPLIRYEVGDYAEAGPCCPCGRGLPTLRRILGRERNLILMPDGTRHWPLVGFHKFRAIAPIVQYQLVQDRRDSVEMRLVVERSLRADEEDTLRTHVQQALGHPFDLRFAYFEHRIPAGPGGKFEEFICRIA